MNFPAAPEDAAGKKTNPNLRLGRHGLGYGRRPVTTAACCG